MDQAGRCWFIAAQTLSRHRFGMACLADCTPYAPGYYSRSYPEAAAIGLPLQRLLRRPLILDYQGSMTSEMLDHGFIRRSNPLFIPLTRLERMLNRAADAVMTSTHNAADLLRRDGSVPEDRLFTIADGVDTERFRPFDGSPEWTTQRAELRAQLGIPPTGVSSSISVCSRPIRAPICSSTSPVRCVRSTQTFIS